MFSRITSSFTVTFYPKPEIRCDRSIVIATRCILDVGALSAAAVSVAELGSRIGWWDSHLASPSSVGLSITFLIAGVFSATLAHVLIHPHPTPPPTTSNQALAPPPTTSNQALAPPPQSSNEGNGPTSSTWQKTAVVEEELDAMDPDPVFPHSRETSPLYTVVRIPILHAQPLWPAMQALFSGRLIVCNDHRRDAGLTNWLNSLQFEGANRQFIMSEWALEADDPSTAIPVIRASPKTEIPESDAKTRKATLIETLAYIRTAYPQNSAQWKALPLRTCWVTYDAERRGNQLKEWHLGIVKMQLNGQVILLIMSLENVSLEESRSVYVHRTITQQDDLQPLATHCRFPDHDVATVVKIPKGTYLDMIGGSVILAPPVDQFISSLQSTTEQELFLSTVHARALHPKRAGILATLAYINTIIHQEGKDIPIGTTWIATESVTRGASQKPFFLFFTIEKVDLNEGKFGFEICELTHYDTLPPASSFLFSYPRGALTTR